MKIPLLTNKILLAGMIALGAMVPEAMFPGASFARELKFAHVYEVSHPSHKAALKAAALFEKRTDGRYTISVFPASSLGKELDLNEGLAFGTADIIYTGANFMGSIYKPIVAITAPFAFRGIAHWKQYHESDLFKEVSERYKEASGGNEIAAVIYYGARHVTSNKPILEPADMKDLKIRVPNAPIYKVLPDAVGANAAPIAFSEVYLALQQGVVDAQENPLTTIRAKRFYEVQSNINLTGHVMDSLYSIISPALAQELSPADRAILFKTLQETSLMATEEIINDEKNLADWFRKKGIQVNEVDRTAFQKAVLRYLEKEGDSLPFPQEFYKKVQTISD